ncbi:MAG: glycosyltransferase [Bacteroidales bacterium]|nr:glycosyltransferase [Bacteroidales bacterium]
MKILLLCNKSPWPLHEGGPIAMYAIINGLLEAGHQVKVLAANTNKYAVDPITLPEEFAKNTGIEFAYIDLSIKPLAALSNYISGTSYHVSRFRNTEFAEKLEKILKKDTFDIIQVEMLYTTVYMDIIRKHSKAPVVLRAHNIEHLIWKRIAENCRIPFKKHYLNQLYLSLRDYEMNVINKVDGIVSITFTDAVFFGRNARNVPVLAVPFGIDPQHYPVSTRDTATPDLFNIGSMNWIPNAEGIQWFLNKVWPEVTAKNPGIELHLAGRKMPEWMLHFKSPGLIIEGEVPDARDFMKQHDIMIVPLFSGSGIRIKIIEAMTAGKVVISSTIGAEGIEYKNGEHLLIADTREQFIEAINRVVNDKQFRRELAENARKLMLSLHDNHVLIERLVSFYQRLIKSH